jgi:phosphoribosylformylglycinamidine synthase II
LNLWREPDIADGDFGDTDFLATRLAEFGIHLNGEELALAADRFGRTPSWAEIVCLNVLWSEHCSYRSTRHLLGRLPGEAPQVLVGTGQDAGVVSLGEHDGVRYGAVIAHESHNHPSQVVPYEGAATGVGGIVRDVACMGAKVVGVLDALRFGTGRHRPPVVIREIIREVVDGVAGYANALGVPNLGGDVYFDSGFDANCLVNVVAVGLVRADGIIASGAPAAQDSALILVGKPTDDSGFGGAAFASTVLAEEESERRGAVQLPDPFLLRALTVANEELVRRARERGWAIGCKDLGAGGLACASVELADAAGLGADLWLDRIHRITGEVPPWVLLCAETQERYCWAVPWEVADEVCAIFNREHRLAEVYPGAGATLVGRTRSDGVYRVTWDEEPLIDCQAKVMTEGIRSPRPSQSRRRPQTESVAGDLPLPSNPEIAARLLGHLALASRAYLYERYDPDVQGVAVVRRGEASAGVIAPVEGAGWGLAVSLAGNPHYGLADPYWGAAHAVCESTRRVVAVGGWPWALTDCLNFGSALDPEVMGDFEAAIEGLRVAATAIGTEDTSAALPFVSGNVSLYNQDEEGRAIPPSPIVACLGRVRDLNRVVTPGLKQPGNILVYVGPPRGDISGSHFARLILGESRGLPQLDLDAERERQRAVRSWIESGWVRSCRVVGEGGIGTAVANMAFASAARLGAAIEWPAFASLGNEEQHLWWSEEPGFLLEVSTADAPRLLREGVAESLGVVPVGQVRGEYAVTVAGDRSSGWRLDLEGLQRRWLESLSSAWQLDDEPLGVSR